MGMMRGDALCIGEGHSLLVSAIELRGSFFTFMKKRVHTCKSSCWGSRFVCLLAWDFLLVVCDLLDAL